MNKKIYFNDKFIEFSIDEKQSSQNQLIKTFDLSGKDKNLSRDVLRNFLDPANKHSIKIAGDNFEHIFNNFKNELYYIEAAGGLIQKNDEYLFIHRHGRWDLPKGKLENGETIPDCAVRECGEECGVSGLSIKEPLTSTFHIYPYKKGHAIKQSFWFLMETNFNKALVPQTEESIDQVKWCAVEEIKSVIIPDTYYTIRDVVTEGLKL